MFVLGTVAILRGALLESDEVLKVVFVSMGLLMVGLTLRNSIATQPVARVRGKYWWLGLAFPVGIGTWATFLYLGLTTSRKIWLGWSALYLALVAAGLSVNIAGGDEGTSSDVATALIFPAWIGGIVQGFVIRRRVRAELDGAAYSAYDPLGRIRAWFDEVSEAPYALWTFPVLGAVAITGLAGMYLNRLSTPVAIAIELMVTAYFAALAVNLSGGASELEQSRPAHPENEDSPEERVKAIRLASGIIALLAAFTVFQMGQQL